MQPVQLSSYPMHFRWCSQYHSKTRGQNHICLLQKKRKHSQWVSATIGIEIHQEPLHLPWPKGKDSETGGQMASEWQIDWIPASKYSHSISAFLTDQTTIRPNKSRKRRIRTWAEHSRLQSRQPLMGTLGVHQNIPASDTKLTHSLGIYLIGPPLVMDKLIPV